MNKLKLVPMIFRGEVVQDYWLDTDGNPYSTKWNKLRKLATPIPTNKRYPVVKFRLHGKQVETNVHRVVCETFHPFPTPRGVTESEWKRTPASIKSILKSTYQVNHIDHVHSNFHPSNLEWVTPKENADAWQIHKRDNNL